MKRLLVLAFLALAATAMTTQQASAQYPGNAGFLPWGFYQPYGARYGTSLKTPPYFATNPPVYYGARHARPYGLSPFASPPLVQPSDAYRSRLRSKFSVPPPGLSEPLCNPCISHSTTIKKPSNDGQVAKADGQVVKGRVQFNPYVDSGDQLALN